MLNITVEWAAVGGAALATLVAMVSLYVSFSTFKTTLQTSHYGELDKMYFDLLSHRLSKPHLRHAGAARGHQEEAEYDVYAHMVWNFVEAIHDRCKRDAILCATWYPVIKVENDLHRTWLLTEGNRVKFKAAFYEFIRDDLFSDPLSGQHQLTMKRWSLLFLRLTIGALLVWWGLDKLVQVDHGVQVAQHFYLGVGASRPFLQAFGIFETALGLSIMLGWGRRWTYPLLLLIAAVTAIGVWRSVVDPWGWVFEGSNALFYPSAIVFAGSLVLWAFRDSDLLALDARAAANPVGGRDER